MPVPWLLVTVAFDMDGVIDLAQLIGPPITLVPCRGEWETMFSEEIAGVAQAKAICATCPEKKHLECLEFSFLYQEEFGTWGGVSAVERADLIAYNEQLRGG